MDKLCIVCGVKLRYFPIDNQIKSIFPEIVDYYIDFIKVYLCVGLLSNFDSMYHYLIQFALF